MIELSLSSAEISRIEKGHVVAKFGTIVKLAKALDAPELMVERCRDCEIRNDGLQEFFPQINLSAEAEAELLDIADELYRKTNELKMQVVRIRAMNRATKAYIRDHKLLVRMFKELSYAAATGVGRAELSFYLGR